MRRISDASEKFLKLLKKINEEILTRQENFGRKLMRKIQTLQKKLLWKINEKNYDASE